MRFHKGPRGGERAHEKDQGQGNLVSTVAITNEKMLLTLHNENLAQVSTGISCSKIKAFPNVDIDTNVVQNWSTSRVLGQQWLIKATGFFLVVFFQCLFRLEKYVSPWVNTQFGTLCSFTPDLCEVKTFSLPFASFLPLLLVNCGFEKVFFSLSTLHGLELVVPLHIINLLHFFCQGVRNSRHCSPTKLFSPQHSHLRKPRA